jgi:hypothetical protein
MARSDAGTGPGWAGRSHGRRPRRRLRPGSGIWGACAKFAGLSRGGCGGTGRPPLKCGATPRAGDRPAGLPVPPSQPHWHSGCQWPGHARSAAASDIATGMISSCRRSESGARRYYLYGTVRRGRGRGQAAAVLDSEPASDQAVSPRLLLVTVTVESDSHSDCPSCAVTVTEPPGPRQAGRSDPDRAGLLRLSAVRVSGRHPNDESRGFGVLQIGFITIIMLGNPIV